MAHARHVRNFLYYKGAKSDEAEDLMQEAFLRLWRECKKVPAEKAKAFLFRVANNLFLDAELLQIVPILALLVKTHQNKNHYPSRIAS